MDTMAKIELPPLPYDFAALEPHIDAQTMQIHHDKHHAAYVTNLNNALEGQAALQDKSAEALIKDLNSVPESIRMTVRNNAGGHVNHTMFLEIIAPNARGGPTGALMNAIKSSVCDFAAFQDQIQKVAIRRLRSSSGLVIQGRS